MRPWRGRTWRSVPSRPRRAARIGGELRALGRLHHFEDHLAHPEEGLAHRAARGGALAQAPEVESRTAQHLRGAVEVGLHPNDVIDRLDPVGLRPAGRRRPLGGDRAESVELQRRSSPQRPLDDPAPLATAREPQPHLADLRDGALHFKADRAPGGRLVGDLKLVDFGLRSNTVH